MSWFSEFSKSVDASVASVFGGSTKKTNDNPTEQASSDYSAATPSTKVNEVAGKITSSGFKNVTVANGVRLPTSVKSTTSSELNTLNANGNTMAMKTKLIDMQGNTVTFNVMPRISESRSANYDSYTPAHHPGEILKYKNTSNRTWTLSVKLISRTMSEAAENLRVLNVIRSWPMPYYGAGTAASNPVELGAPPQILTLKSYGPGMIGPVPVVLKSYSTDFPDDVDYIQTSDGSDGITPQPFPVILNISLTLDESWSPAEFSKFDLATFKTGDMSSAYAGGKIAKPADTPAQSGASAKDARSEPVTKAKARVNAAVSKVKSKK